MRSGQQWDLPNVWPPLVEVAVTALENTNTSAGRAAASQLAQTFVRNVHQSWVSWYFLKTFKLYLVMIQKYFFKCKNKFDWNLILPICILATE